MKYDIVTTISYPTKGEEYKRNKHKLDKYFKYEQKSDKNEEYKTR